LVIVTTIGVVPPFVPSKMVLSLIPMLICGTGSWVAPASRSSRSSEPNDSRAESVPQPIRMRTSS